MYPVASDMSQARGALSARQATVSISPEMRALFAARLGGACVPEAMTRAPGTASPQKGTAPLPGSERCSPVHEVVLRRDGKRPLRFEGALLFRRCLNVGHLEDGLVIELFVTSDGSAVASLALFPAGSGQENRDILPIHAACIVRSRDDFERFVGTVDPGNAYPAGAGWTALDPAFPTPRDAQHALAKAARIASVARLN